MNQDGREHDEERRITGHLKAEVDEFLKSDGKPVHIAKAEDTPTTTAINSAT
jgi:hypothetical protein